MLRLLALSALPLLLSPLAGQADDTQEPSTTIMDLMLTVVAPATDTLWGIEDPRSDAEWQVFIDAADADYCCGGNTLKIRVVPGPNDDEWASGPCMAGLSSSNWSMPLSSRSRGRRRTRTSTAMYTAGEIIYPPCEECHIRFHPGVSPGFRVSVIARS